MDHVPIGLSEKLKFVALGSVLASVAILGYPHLSGQINDLRAHSRTASGAVDCDSDSVSVHFEPMPLDGEFYESSAEIIAHNQENIQNPSGFSIQVVKSKGIHEYNVGVSSINEEGITGLTEDFLDDSTFTAKQGPELTFRANQAIWSVDVDPQDSEVTVYGVCLTDPNEDTSIQA